MGGAVLLPFFEGGSCVVGGALLLFRFLDAALVDIEEGRGLVLA